MEELELVLRAFRGLVRPLRSSSSVWGGSSSWRGGVAAVGMAVKPKSNADFLIGFGALEEELKLGFLWWLNWTVVWCELSELEDLLRFGFVEFNEWRFVLDLLRGGFAVAAFALDAGGEAVMLI